jgi:hypothetical protein
MPHNPNVGQAFATLRLQADDLDPDQVTKSLGVTPSEAFRRGDPFGRGGLRRRHGHRALCSEGRVASNDLGEHIAWLLDLVEPASDALARLRSQGVDADVFCYLESRAQGGPEFSPTLKGRLALLNLALGIDIYCAQDDDASGASFGGKP